MVTPGDFKRLECETSTMRLESALPIPPQHVVLKPPFYMRATPHAMVEFHSALVTSDPKQPHSPSHADRYAPGQTLAHPY